MKKRKEYSHVIITDSEGKPMAWDINQLCYCTDDTWEDDHHPVKAYSVKRAKELIKKSIAYRTRYNLSLYKGYKTMPINL